MDDAGEPRSSPDTEDGGASDDPLLQARRRAIAVAPPWLMRLLQPWTGVAAFAWLALFQLFLQWISQTLLALALNVVTLGALFAVTPVFARRCRRVAVAPMRPLACAVLALVAAAAWTAATTAYLAQEPDSSIGSGEIAAAGLGAWLLFAPALWLGSGGLVSRGSRPGSASTRALAAGEATAWLIAALVLLARVALAVPMPAWGPMLGATVPVAAIVCTVNAFRASLASWPLVMLATGLGVLYLWWNALLAGSMLLFGMH